MTPAEMLAELNREGQEAVRDFNDDDGVNGWLGWSVNGDVFTVSYRPCAQDGRPGLESRSSWRLVPIGTAAQT